MNTNKSFSPVLFLLVVACVTTSLLWTTPAQAQAGVGTAVDLQPNYNVYGIYTDGTSFTTGGLDGVGYAYSANVIGDVAPTWPPDWTTSFYTLTFGGLNFNVSWGDEGTAQDEPNVASGDTALPNSTPVTLPTPGTTPFYTLVLLGTGVEGTQVGQIVTVNYSDGSSDTFTQTFGDWYSGHCEEPGETLAIAMPYRDTASGGQDHRNFFLCLYSFPVNPSKTPTTLVLPNTRDVVIFAASMKLPSYTIQAATASPTQVAPGSSATAPITVAPQPGYSGTVTLSCTIAPTISQLPVGASDATPPTCGFGSTSPVTVASGQNSTATLTFTAAAPQQAMLRRHSGMFYALWLPIPGLALAGFGAGSQRRRRLLGLLMLGLLLTAIVATPACVTYTHLGNVGTPAGPYTVTITGLDSNGVNQASNPVGTTNTVVVTVNQ